MKPHEGLDAQPQLSSRCCGSQPERQKGIETGGTWHSSRSSEVMIKGDKPSSGTKEEMGRVSRELTTARCNQAFVPRYQWKGLGCHEEVWTPAPCSRW